MQPFQWEIGNWLCEVEDTPHGPLCTCRVAISADTITEWNTFSKQYRRIQEIVKKAGVFPNPIPYYNLRTIQKDKEPPLKIVIAIAWKNTVPTDVMFSEAETMISDFEELTDKWGVKFEKIKNK